MADADMAAAAAATEQVAIGVVKLSKPVEEHTMEFDGFKCPDQMVNDFTPLEFEDLVVLFKKYDVDGSGEINPEELRKILHDMDMDFSLDQAGELMAKIDKDGSGILEFAEFVTFVGMVKRGDTELRGFAKLAADMDETPVAVLEMECKRRELASSYQHIETREATSMHSEYFVMEVTLVGHWFELVDGQPRSYNGAKRFQGIAKNTREAKMAAAKSALAKLKDLMPGLKSVPGELPRD